MKIAVLGTGVVGQTLADKLAATGHDVRMGTRDPEAARARTGEDNFGRPPFPVWMNDHPDIGLGTFAEAAAFGELIVNATNGAGSLEALEAAGQEHLAGKILVDVANPLDFSRGMPPTLLYGNTDSLGERIQRTFPGTRVVKTLNTLNAFLMVEPGLLPERHNLFLSGDDAGAKETVRELLESFRWKAEDIVDLGDISTARGTEQWLPLWVRLWGATGNPMFNIRLVMGKAPGA